MSAIPCLTGLLMLLSVAAGKNDFPITSDELTEQPELMARILAAMGPNTTNTTNMTNIAQMSCRDAFAYGWMVCEQPGKCSAECEQAIAVVTSKCGPKEMHMNSHEDEYEARCVDPKGYDAYAGQVDTPNDCLELCKAKDEMNGWFSLSFTGECLCHAPGGCEDRVHGVDYAVYAVEEEALVDIAGAHGHKCDQMRDNRCYELFYYMDGAGCFQSMGPTEGPMESSFCSPTCQTFVEESMWVCDTETIHDEDGEWNIKQTLSEYRGACGGKKCVKVPESVA